MSTNISKHVNAGKIHLTQLNTSTLNSNQYNSLLLSKGFWKHLISRRKILIFQTDSIICPNSDFTIEDFTSYDYIGSKWPRVRPVGLIIDGGNGGLSLRDWNLSIDCLNRFPTKKWCGGEDGYYPPRNRHGIHFISLKKPYGIGMEKWLMMKRLWKEHAPASRGVIFVLKESNFSISNKRRTKDNDGQSYG